MSDKTFLSEASLRKCHDAGGAAPDASEDICVSINHVLLLVRCDESIIGIVSDIHVDV